MINPLIQTKALSKRFIGNQVLNDIDISVDRGKSLLIIVVDKLRQSYSRRVTGSLLKLDPTWPKLCPWPKLCLQMKMLSEKLVNACPGWKQGQI